MPVLINPHLFQLLIMWSWELVLVKNLIPVCVARRKIAYCTTNGIAKFLSVFLSLAYNLDKNIIPIIPILGPHDHITLQHLQLLIHQYITYCAHVKAITMDQSPTGSQQTSKILWCCSNPVHPCHALQFKAWPSIWQIFSKPSLLYPVPTKLFRSASHFL